MSLVNPLFFIFEYPNSKSMIVSFFGYMAGMILGNPHESLLNYFDGIFPVLLLLSWDGYVPGRFSGLLLGAPLRLYIFSEGVSYWFSCLHLLVRHMNFPFYDASGGGG